MRRSRTHPIEIMYVLSSPSTESETMMLNARVDPSWMRQRMAQMKDVAYTALKGMSHFLFLHLVSITPA